MFLVGGIGDRSGDSDAEFFALAQIDFGIDPLFCCIDVELIRRRTGGTWRGGGYRGLRLRARNCGREYKNNWEAQEFWRMTKSHGLDRFLPTFPTYFSASAA